ncbi:MAG TPA: hypothetical protein VF397_00220 [Pyrinomonadaceae bacterium]
MSLSENALILNLDPVTADFLVELAKSWDVSQEEAVRRAVEMPALLDDLLEVLENDAGLQPLELNDESHRDVLVLTLHRQGYSNIQIANELGEDVKVIRLRWCRVLYRLGKLLHQAKTKTLGVSDRWQTFQDLQRRLGLSATQAAEWQEALYEARR